MQAIVVKYIGPTNSKPSRWKAECQAGSLTVSKGHFCDTNDDEDAQSVALALVAKLKWNCAAYGRLVEGGLPNGDRVFVFAAGVDSELLAALKRAVPWLGKLIADGGHNASVAPQDAVGALQQAEAAIAKAS